MFKAQTGRAQRDCRKALVASEYQEQAKVIEWWGWNHKKWGLDERLLYAVPNGAHLAGNDKQRAIQMKKLKKQGLRTGALDLNLDVPLWRRVGTSTGVCDPVLWNDPQRLFSGLRIEMKRKGGKPSQAQREFADLLRRQGYSVVIAQGATEAIRTIEAYLGK